MRIEAADLDDTRVQALLRTHLALSQAVSPPGAVHALDLSGLQIPEVTVWAAWDAETLLGLGALKRLGGGHAEVKSMHTAQAARRRGVAATLLERIIETAQAEGLSRLSLETGNTADFAAARALYARRGFTPCPPFAQYVDDGFSTCMTLAL